MNITVDGNGTIVIINTVTGNFTFGLQYDWFGETWETNGHTIEVVCP